MDARIDGGDFLPADSLDTEFQSAMEQHEGFAGALGIGGAAIGGAVGMVIAGPLGASIGVLVGLLVRFLAPIGGLKEQYRANLEQLFHELRVDIDKRIHEQETPWVESLTQTVSRVHRRLLHRFNTWIAGAIQAERKKIADERARLRHLLAVRTRLVAHRARLEHLLKTADAASIGLCR